MNKREYTKVVKLAGQGVWDMRVLRACIDEQEEHVHELERSEGRKDVGSDMWDYCVGARKLLRQLRRWEKQGAKGVLSFQRMMHTLVGSGGPSFLDGKDCWSYGDFPSDSPCALLSDIREIVILEATI